MTTNLRILTRDTEKRPPMKRILTPATTVVAVLMLVLFASAIAFSQQLQSGALLTITGTSPVVNRAVYDSQIHSGNVQPSPCDGSLVTDAYVLQGGTPTGCDEGDPYEVTATNNPNTHQAQGTATVSGPGYNLTITTFYLCGGSCTGTPISVPPTFTPAMNGNPDGVLTPGGGPPFCNTTGNICTSPDTGFLAVTNSEPINGPAFTGTFTLAGTSGCGPASRQHHHHARNLAQPGCLR